MATWDMSGGMAGPSLSDISPVALSMDASVNGAECAGSLIYRMRGYDGTLVRDVYWSAATVDAAGAEYTGPGPLSNIVVSNIY